MRVAVAGANGFVGRHLINYLALKNISYMRLSRDDLDDNSLDRALADCNVVVNCIGEKSGIGSRAETANKLIPIKLFAASRRNRVDQFVHVSSVAAIASKTKARALVDDSTTPSPSTPYGMSKLQADKALSLLGGPVLSILRPPILIGHDAPGVYALLRMAAKHGLPLPLGGVNSPRSFMHVDNFAEAIFAAIRHKLEGSYIVTDSKPISSQNLYLQMLASAGFGSRVFTITPLGRAIMRLCLGRRADSLFAPAVYDGRRFFNIAQPIWPIDPESIVHASMFDQ